VIPEIGTGLYFVDLFLFLKFFFIFLYGSMKWIQPWPNEMPVNFLVHVITSAKEDMFSSLFVCLSGKVGNGPMNKWQNFGGDPDPHRGTGKTRLGGGMHCPSASSSLLSHILCTRPTLFTAGSSGMLLLIICRRYVAGVWSVVHFVCGGISGRLSTTPVLSTHMSVKQAKYSAYTGEKLQTALARDGNVYNTTAKNI